MCFRMISLQGGLHCSPDPAVIVTRPALAEDTNTLTGLQTLCLYEDGYADEIIGSHSRSGLELGPVISQLSEGTANVYGAVYDTFSESVCYICGRALYSFGNDNRGALVAGNCTLAEYLDGPARQSRFLEPSLVCSTGRGALYVVDRSRIRKVQLPVSWRGGEAADAAAQDANVSTFYTVSEPQFRNNTKLVALDYLSDSDSLVFSTYTALYRLPLSGSAAVGEGGALQAELLAGVEGSEGSSDGVGGAARFQRISGLTVDATGCIYVIDRVHAYQLTPTVVRKVTADGTVSTVTKAWDCPAIRAPVILPNGYLAMCALNQEQLHYLDLGLTPRSCRPDPGPLDPPRRPLAADLGALLQRQPDGTADVTIVVGDRSFPVHRAILAARCDYFQQRLEGGFADSRAPTIDLPDADPDVFSLLLRFIYTGAVDIRSELLRPVAELADRLLLADLRGQAEAQLLAEVTPETLADLMLWAHSCQGTSCTQLLSRLKLWYLGHAEEVLDRGQESMERLIREQPALVLELMQEAQGFRRVQAKKLRFS